MNILQVAIIVFCFLEGLNILVLYTKPMMKKGNGIGVFKVLSEVDETDHMFALIKYLTNWVANFKVIFIALAITIVIFGNETTQFYAVIALLLSILLFYITLFPILKKLDNENMLTPKGYSKTLAYTILSFLLMFVIALILFVVI